MRMEGKTVLITGATGQLGRQYCHAFAREGAQVIVSDLNFESCNRLVKELDGSREHYGVMLDVADPDSVTTAFFEIEKKSAVLDVLINNAGIAVFEPFEERKFDDFMKVLRVNVGGTFLCIQAASKLMREKTTKGSIINIGSIYGIGSSDPRIYTDCNRKNSECYGASKAAVIYMTKYFAVHLAPYGIRVNAISPGGIYNNQGEDFVKHYSEKTPMGRMGKEGELMGAAIFLASEESSYVTGQNLCVDGGWTAW
ncbi:MAG: SDR family oxidoreductase [bacterium]|nr:SDR family oxidoreductase [bacterium]